MISGKRPTSNAERPTPNGTGMFPVLNPLNPVNPIPIFGFLFSPAIEAD
jgi:hypothetical protein